MGSLNDGARPKRVGRPRPRGPAAPARWRGWMGRVEAVIFASAEPVLRESLARVVGKGCNLELIVDDIRDELRGRPYEIVNVAGGWSFRTKLGFGEAIRAALGGPQEAELSKSNALILMAIGYFQPITRGIVTILRPRGLSRHNRQPARRRVHRRRAAQPDPRRALRLCHHAGVPCAFRVRIPA
jgi:chromosome segregation and condensation protein ScpB